MKVLTLEKCVSAGFAAVVAVIRAPGNVTSAREDLASDSVSGAVAIGTMQRLSVLLNRATCPLASPANPFPGLW